MKYIYIHNKLHVVRVSRRAVGIGTGASTWATTRRSWRSKATATAWVPHPLATVWPRRPRRVKSFPKGGRKSRRKPGESEKFLKFWKWGKMSETEFLKCQKLSVFFSKSLFVFWKFSATFFGPEVFCHVKFLKFLSNFEFQYFIFEDLNNWQKDNEASLMTSAHVSSLFTMCIGKLRHQFSQSFQSFPQVFFFLAALVYTSSSH